LRTSETVAWLTPASRATSRCVNRPVLANRRSSFRSSFVAYAY
jgi:hypothetical protein